jgi:DNA mismatch repair protein MutS
VDVFGSLPNECIEAAAAIVDYIGIAHIGANTKLDFPKMIDSGEYIQIDYFTKKSLELNKSLGDNKKSTLLNTIDKTMTAQGSRLLSEWLANPLSNVEKINKRLSFVEFFVANKDLTKTIRSHLSKIPDLERALSRICMNRSCPRDLGIIRNALIEIHCLNNIICSIPDLATLDTSFSTCQAIIKSLEDALNEINLPLSANDGNFIKDGYDRELDEQRGFVKNSTRTIVSLQQKYVAQTGIYNLKVKKNGVLGYFIETTVNNASRIPYEFVHKQTLASCIRYVTKELIDIANATYSSEGSSKARELLVFDKLREMVCMSYEHIKSASQKISFVDCISALAALAIENNYVKPQIVVEKIIDIENGRHPVVEERLKQDGSHFVSNDCSMNENSVIAIITGPNMGGKSTYLRQNAIIIIMAQIGSYVPASKAVIGVVDKIFSRVGASDDISAGKSTFMVEMVETSIILRQATDRSFVILDEVGRGTSTYDGLAIAWAILLEIHDNIKARTLFATHYHELKKISDDNRNVKFLTVLVEENNQDIVFLYKIANGFADKSYGLHVASIAGFPKHVIAQAKMLLEEMTK